AFVLQTEKREAGILPTFDKVSPFDVLAMKNARYHYLLIRFLNYFDNLRVLAIVRNPCAALTSWMENPREFPEGSDPMREWRLGTCKNQGRPENFFGFYKWREAANIFLDLQSSFQNRVHVVRYEDLIENPIGVSQELFAFCGLEFGEQTEKFLRESSAGHSDSPYSVYRGKDVNSSWRGKLDSRIVKDIEQELLGTRLETFLV
ncbi:MAG: sulfotransferase domain-containing protein, partial [Ktedonobacteraceae bacterium]